jgi:hypothetical protein
VGEKKIVGRDFVGKPKGRRPLKRHGLHGKVILKQILKE